MIESILIANRGEIARRIIRTARRMGVRSIAVFSEADAGAAHTREADASVLVGPAAVAESYLNAPSILAAAAQSGARAVHPGYGFLSENAEFAEAVIAAGLAWIGPPPAAIRAMGRKDEAKRVMAAAGVPVTPGYLGEDQADGRLLAEGKRIGWPVLIKAVAGGGGKGMRLVGRQADFATALAGARREGEASFGDSRVLLEAYVGRARHIEVQVFADNSGRCVHLFERDCSLQRRHQKVIEEAPAPGMDAATREAVCAAAVRAAQAVGYQGAGTVEFIADVARGLRRDAIWFMEMNTRLQVEHPVTEAVTGVDLVEWQIRVAAGEDLPLRQDELGITGHAIEARLYAEDPSRGFLPSTGRLRRFRLPAGVRIDSGVEEGDLVSPHYDPMIGKLISHAGSRREAAAGLARACAGIEVWPVRTNAGLLSRCLADRDFVDGAVDTAFIADRQAALVARPRPSAAVVTALALDAAPTPAPWSAPGGVTGFRVNAEAAVGRLVFIDGEATQAEFDFTATAAPFLVDGDCKVVFEGGEAFCLSLVAERAGGAAAAAVGGWVRAPMPGRLIAVAVKVGERVQAGQTLAVLEAMKMEHSLIAPCAGTVAEVMGGDGDQLVEGAAVVRIEPGR